MRHTRTLLLLGVIGLAGCQSGPKTPPNTVETVRAKGRVVAVAPERWEVTLETPGGRRLGYWTESTIFIRGQQAMADFVLSPGMYIEYKGLENRGETWLRMVWILKD